MPISLRIQAFLEMRKSREAGRLTPCARFGGALLHAIFRFPRLRGSWPDLVANEANAAPIATIASAASQPGSKSNIYSLRRYHSTLISSDDGKIFYWRVGTVTPQKDTKTSYLADILLPDRDNTFAAFLYTADGKISPKLGLDAPHRAQALGTLSLTGLDKAISNTLDQNGKLVALDRVSQRMEAWGIAEESRADILSVPGSQPLRDATIRTAKALGFFSIWMTVYAGDFDMRNRLIDAFAGTRNSRCFDAATSEPIPAPNPDGLANGSKI